MRILQIPTANGQRRALYRAHTALSADEPQLPYFPYWFANCITMLVVLSIVLSLAFDARFPAATILLSAAVSAICLFLIRVPHSDDQGFMRIGFHAGIVTFFMLMPLLFPDETAARISNDTREQIDLSLLLSVLGFEAGYWLTYAMRPARTSQASALDSARGAPAFLVRLILMGVVVWAAYQVAYAAAIRARLIDVLLAMRNPIEGAADGDVGFVWKYGLRTTMALLFLSAAAGCVIAVDRRSAIWPRILAWGVIIGVAVIGFLTGSRGYFLFTAVPSAVAAWFTVMRLPKFPALRPLLVGTAIVAVATIWWVMSAIRDVERVDDVLLHPVTPVFLAEGAFDIYSQMAVVVESFPRLIEYQYGVSAVPLVLGWVPRAIWPQKPYPFSLVMNYLQGEDLDRRTASFAPGLPAEGYGNFGLAGVVLWVWVMAVFCRFGDDYLQRIGLRNPLGLQLAGIWCTWVALIVRGGVAEMVYMGLEVTVAPLALTVYAATRSPGMSHDLHVPNRRHLA